MKITLMLLLAFSVSAWSQEEDLDFDEETKPPPAVEKPKPAKKTKITKAKTRKVEKPAPRAPTESPFGIELGVGYGMGGTAKFASGKQTTAGVTQDFSASYDIEAAPLVYLGAIYTEPYAWGGFFRIVYQLDRKIKNLKINDALYVTDSKAQIMNLEAGAHYRWSQIYVPFGFNYTMPKIKETADAGTTTTVKGELGAQFGVGFHPAPKVTVEALFKMISLSSKTTSTAVDLDLGKGNLGYVEIKAGYQF